MPTVSELGQPATQSAGGVRGRKRCAGGRPATLVVAGNGNAVAMSGKSES